MGSGVAIPAARNLNAYSNERRALLFLRKRYTKDCRKEGVLNFFMFKFNASKRFVLIIFLPISSKTSPSFSKFCKRRLSLTSKSANCGFMTKFSFIVLFSVGKTYFAKVVFKRGFR